MQHLHIQEKEQFIKLFKQEHLEDFEDRFKILETFLQTEQHVTAEELGQQLVERGHSLPPALVRNTLNMMCHYGFAQKNSFENGEIRYEHRHLGQHHDHMICTKCRNIFEFKNDQIERLQVKIAKAHGFHLLQHKMEFYGICGACLTERARQIPLAMARQGERLVIREFRGGASARMRLMTMGLRLGDEISVISSQPSGQMVVALDFKRLVLGKGMALKIIVENADAS
jgi:Fur family ferric uptake transcriptional regulator